MFRLKSRVRPIPNGLRYAMPEINWNSVKVVGKFPSWEVLVNAVVAARAGNPHHREKHGWSLDVETVAGEVDAYNTQICLAQGWNQFVIGGDGGAAPRPLPQPRSPEQEKLLSAAAVKARKLWEGVKTVSDWLDSNEPAVPQELSEKRAETCVACPFNGQGDLTSFFTTVASAAIKRQLERAQSKNLSTTLDAKLGVCSQKPEEGNGGCLCPLKLAVHVPLKIKLAHMSPDVLAGLHKDCWVKNEVPA